MKTLRWMLHLLFLRPFLRLFFGVNVRGREHLQGLDQFIVVANHNSHLDTLLIYTALPARRLHDTYPVAAKDYFAKAPRLFRFMNRFFNPIWVDREGAAGGTLSEMERRLAEGGSIIIFPEGTRGEPGRMQEFKSGIGHLVARYEGVPVLPVFILGPERSLPRKASVPLPLWNQLVIGPPQRMSGQARDLTRALEGAVTELAHSASAGRHRRRERRREGFAVAVLGIDGSGKSTLSSTLTRHLSEEATTCLISDQLQLFEGGAPRQMQPLMVEKIRVWLGRQAKQAKSLASYKIPKLSEMLLRNRLLIECRRWYDPAWIVLDGSPLLNLAAWAVLYREEFLNEAFCARALDLLSGRVPLKQGDPLADKFPEIRVLAKLGLTQLEAPKAVAFLDLRPDLAMARIESRGERKQVHETEEKLSKLRNAYDMVCKVIAREWELPVLRFDGSLGIEEQGEKAHAFVREAGR